MSEFMGIESLCGAVEIQGQMIIMIDGRVKCQSTIGPSGKARLGI